jgi:hypothetical protein
MRSMTIRAVTRSAGVGMETVRAHERQRLVARPPRERGACRLYPRTAAAALVEPAALCRKAPPGNRPFHRISGGPTHG